MVDILLVSIIWKLATRVKYYKMMRDERIKYFVPADYSVGKELDRLVKDIITRTAINEKLERKYYSCQNELIQHDSGRKLEDKKKTDLILALEASRSLNRHIKS